MTVFPTYRGPMIDKLLGVGFVRSFQIRCMLPERPSMGGIFVPRMGKRGSLMFVLRLYLCLAFDGCKILLLFDPRSHDWDGQGVVPTAGLIL